LSNRSQFVTINNIKLSFKTIEYGVPQGSILDPLLFIIYINNLPMCLQTIPRLFADDTSLYKSQSTLSKMAGLANNELNNISQWLLSNGLTLLP